MTVPVCKKAGLNVLTAPAVRLNCLLFFVALDQASCGHTTICAARGREPLPPSCRRSFHAGSLIWATPMALIHNCQERGRKQRMRI